MPPVSLLTTGPAASTGPALDPAALPPATIEALYVHIPFCFHKCHYCDFYSITRQTEPRMAQFVDRLLAEAGQWTRPTPGRHAPPPRPRTVFFGGGTPSLLPIAHMERLIRGLRERLDLGHVQEWTVEVNPATASAEYCRMLRDTGVDRLSFGAQSFDRTELKVLERHHDPEDVARSVEIATAAGFRRLNLDLIFAIPGQDLASWDRSLSAAMDLRTTHLSCYGLTYEPNTPIAVRKRLGQLRDVVEEDVELGMLRHTRKRLIAAGLAPYEISNFAAPGQQCLHNLVYWTGGNYIGLGPSAASHVEGWRWRNRPHLREWEEAVDAAHLPAIDVEHLTRRRRDGELAMLMLRLSGGIDLPYFSSRTGSDAAAIFSDLLRRLEKVEVIRVTADSIRLTDKGLAVADAVAAEFLADND
jgi:oxygen-independent coproporphyrinogen-3 oxidase